MAEVQTCMSTLASPDACRGPGMGRGGLRSEAVLLVCWLGWCPLSPGYCLTAVSLVDPLLELSRDTREAGQRKWTSRATAPGGLH